MGWGEFTVGDLTAIIGDNAPHGEHRAGYNGVHSLTSTCQGENLFVPGIAGLNLEHIFDGGALTRDELFEPRHAVMTFERIDDQTARLHQPPTPRFALESTTTFTLRPPHYLDMRFECVAHEPRFRHGYIGLFWASYINAPLDKSLYFVNRGRWVQFCTQLHDRDSTVLPDDDTETMPPIDGDHAEMLFTSKSPLRFSEPFYYGRFHGMVYLLVFDRMRGIRFSHSPSGGGDAPAAHTTNPAWDFQYLIPDYEIGARYEFAARLVYKPFAGRDDVLDEVRRWHTERASETS